MFGGALMDRFLEIWRYRSMLWSLILSDLRTRYKGSFFGFMWTFMNPLLMLVVYSLVYSFVLRINMKHYPVFLFIGLLAWNLFSTSALSSSRVIISQASMVKKIYFPREILPLSVVGGGIFNYLFSLIILIPFLLFTGNFPTLYWLYFPLILLVEILITAGFSLLFSVLNVFFRDLEHMLGIFLMLWFYLTPIFYSISFIPENYQFLFKINPLTSPIISLQNIFYYNQPVPWKLFLYGLIFGIIIFFSGWIVFGKLNRRLAEEV